MNRFINVVLGGLLMLNGMQAMAMKTIQVPITQNQFQVELNANPTTGYQWQVTSYDKTRFKLVKGQYLRPNTKLIGSGGVMQYQFALKKGQTYPASTTMLFTYQRPWDTQSATVEKVIIQFVSGKV